MGAAAPNSLTLLREAFFHLGEVAFDMPGRWWLLVPALVVVILAPLRRRRGALLPSILRAVAVAALVAVICRPFYMEQSSRPGQVVVIADTSPSVGAGGIDRIREHLRAIPAVAGAAIVGFGADAQIFDNADALTPDDRPTTDIAAALRFAEAYAGATRPLRLVLFSDGRATTGGTDETALRLRARGVEIVALGVPDTPPASPPSFRVLRLRALDVEEPGAVPTLVATIAAETEATVGAALFLDGREVHRWSWKLAAGTHDRALPPIRVPAGQYNAQLLLNGDRTPDDNEAATSLRVAGAPRVLCIAQKQRKSLIADALSAQGMDVTVAGADAALDGFDAVIILPDADARALDDRSAEIAEFVGARGGGLLAIGGSEGGGLARFAESATAYLLPVEVERRRAPEDKPAPPEANDESQPKIEIKEEETQAYPITLCLLVDRSGSMQGEKILRAKASAAAAAAALTTQDRIAVIAFGNTATVVVAPRPAGDAAAVQRAIAGLPADGRTAMFAALSAGYALMDKEKTPIRHIVLISDGVPTDHGRWRDLVMTGRKNKITLSCVGVGFEVDRRHLGRLSSWGAGKLWTVVHANEIPQVVTQDTQRVVQARNERGKDAERNAPRKDTEREPDKEKPEEPERKPEPDLPTEPTTVQGVPVKLDPTAPRGMFKGVPEDSLPEVTGVEESKPRFASWVAARAGEDAMPLVAYRRVGLGTSAALMTDPEAAGSRALREHTEFPRMIGQLVRSILPDRATASVQITLRFDDGGRRLLITVFGEDGRPRTDLPLLLEISGEAIPTVRRSDRYEAQVGVRNEVVAAHVRVGPPKNPAGKPLAERKFVLPPTRDPERGFTGIDRASLLRIVGTPERMEPKIDAALTPPEAPISTRRPLWLPFLALAAILLPIDAWARRRTKSVSR